MAGHDVPPHAWLRGVTAYLVTKCDRLTLTADHWSKINNQRLAPSVGLFFISRQLSVISSQEFLWQGNRQTASQLYSEAAGAQLGF